MKKTKEQIANEHKLEDIHLQLDLANAEFVDSGGIGLCLSLYKKLKREDIGFQIINVNKRMIWHAFLTAG